MLQMFREEFICQVGHAKKDVKFGADPHREQNAKCPSCHWILLAPGQADQCQKCQKNRDLMMYDR